MSTLTNVTTFEIVTCCNCHIQFAMPTEFRSARLRDHKWFYCPNGHQEHYLGETEEQRLRKRLERAERWGANAEEDARIARADEQAARRKLAAAKGQLTKTRNRVAKGVCPCCNRSFADLHRHMAGQHPDYAPGGDQ